MTQQHPYVGSNRVAFIDVWRLLAVIMVIQAHVLVFSGAEVAWLTPYLLPLDRLSEIGVMIFFFISGYVICSGLIKEQNTQGSVCLRAFYVRRGLRILPPLWFYLLCIWLLHQIDITNTNWKHVLTSALFLCNMPTENACTWFAGHTWTLAYEEQFYLVFPFLFIWVLTQQQTKQLTYLMVAITMGSLLARINGFPLVADYGMYFMFLLTGCLAAMLTQGEVDHIYRLPLSLWLACIASIIFCISYFSVDAERYARTLCYPALLGLIVLCTPTKHPWLSRFFSNPTLCYLGRISYTVYLWQELATAYYPNPSLAATGIYILLVFGFAILSYRYAEQPLARFTAKWSKQLIAQHQQHLH